MPQLEAGDKYTVRADFIQSTHGKQSCSSCHGGVEGAQEKDAAHSGVVKDPSVDSKKNCGMCHSGIANTATSSQHASLEGFETTLIARGGKLGEGPLQQGYDNHCAKCHVDSCGQCHISRPTANGGGLLAGHQFKKTPPMKETCTSCHVTRVGQEYLGENPGLDGDVHWTKGTMLCNQCHGSELHASSKQNEIRYTKAEGPECLGCHEKVTPGKSGIQQHDTHGNKLSCQVCHSVPYKNCSSCHVGKDNNGVAFFKTESTEIDFKIGLNPLQSQERPYKYVTLRHVPAVETAFDFYGKGLQSDFSALPTWKYATPHNIQRKTPQNSSCNACHGNSKLFLTAADVKPAEAEANKKVIVPAVPKAR